MHNIAAIMEVRVCWEPVPGSGSTSHIIIHSLPVCSPALSDSHFLIFLGRLQTSARVKFLGLGGERGEILGESDVESWAEDAMPGPPDPPLPPALSCQPGSCASPIWLTSLANKRPDWRHSDQSGSHRDIPESVSPETDGVKVISSTREFEICQWTQSNEHNIVTWSWKWEKWLYFCQNRIDWTIANCRLSFGPVFVIQEIVRTRKVCRDPCPASHISPGTREWVSPGTRPAPGAWSVVIVTGAGPVTTLTNQPGTDSNLSPGHMQATGEDILRLAPTIKCK